MSAILGDETTLVVLPWYICFSAMYKRNYWQKKLLGVLLIVLIGFGGNMLTVTLNMMLEMLVLICKRFEIFWCITIPSKPNLWYQFKPFILSAENFMCLCMDYITAWYERIPCSNGLTHGINLLNFYPYLSNLTVKLFHVFLIQLSKYEVKKNKCGK